LYKTKTWLIQNKDLVEVEILSTTEVQQLPHQSGKKLKVIILDLINLQDCEIVLLIDMRDD